MKSDNSDDESSEEESSSGKRVISSQRELEYLNFDQSRLSNSKRDNYQIVQSRQFTISKSSILQSNMPMNQSLMFNSQFKNSMLKSLSHAFNNSFTGTLINISLNSHSLLVNNSSKNKTESKQSSQKKNDYKQYHSANLSYPNLLNNIKNQNNNSRNFNGSGNEFAIQQKKQYSKYLQGQISIYKDIIPQQLVYQWLGLFTNKQDQQKKCQKTYQLNNLTTEQEQILEYLMRNLSIINPQDQINKYNREDLIRIAKKINKKYLQLRLNYKQLSQYLDQLFDSKQFKICSKFKLLNIPQSLIDVYNEAITQQSNYISNYYYQQQEKIPNNQEQKNIINQYKEQSKHPSNYQKSQHKQVYMTLNLSSVKVDIQRVIKSQLKNLIQLDLSICQINTQSAQKLFKNISRYRQLRKLNLKRNKIITVKKTILRNLYQLNNLKLVNLFDNDLDPQTLQLFKQKSQYNKRYNLFRLQYTKTHDCSIDSSPLNNILVVDKFAQKVHNKVSIAYSTNDKIKYYIDNVNKLKLSEKEFIQRTQQLLSQILYGQLKRIIIKYNSSASKTIEQTTRNAKQLGQLYLSLLDYSQLLNPSRKQKQFDQQTILIRRQILQQLVRNLQQVFKQYRLTQNYTLMINNIKQYQKKTKNIPIYLLINGLVQIVKISAMQQGQQFVGLIQIVMPLLKQLLNDLLNIFKTQSKVQQNHQTTTQLIPAISNLINNIAQTEQGQNIIGNMFGIYNALTKRE